MPIDTFWDEPELHSEVKIAIVNKFFVAWARIICRSMSAPYAVYIDLYAGRGIYKDGTPSTPLRVTQKTISESLLANKMRLVFNEADIELCNTLRQSLASIENLNLLTYQPEVYSFDVADYGLQIVHMYRNVPKLAFVDPWGYKGVTRDLLKAIIVDWGSDCILFFNYRRVRAAVDNPVFHDHMVALFGEARLAQLQKQLSSGVTHPEATLLNALCNSLEEIGAVYTLPFTFRSPAGTSVTHHLIYMSKSKLGYGIMKEIMAVESSLQNQGVSSFQYCEADENQPRLFELTRPIDDLIGILLKKFCGQTIKVQDIYDQHNVGTPYVKANYKTALLQLEEWQMVYIDPPANERPKRNGARTLGDERWVTFLGGCD